MYRKVWKESDPVGATVRVSAVDDSTPEALPPAELPPAKPTKSAAKRAC
jgi:hypothetical protein